MKWQIEDIQTYNQTKLTNNAGSQIMYRQEDECWVVRRWHQKAKRFGKDKPLLKCAAASDLIEWLTRMGYEYR